MVLSCTPATVPGQLLEPPGARRPLLFGPHTVLGSSPPSGKKCGRGGGRAPPNHNAPSPPAPPGILVCPRGCPFSGAR